MVTIEPAHIRSTDQAEHVLAVRQIEFHRTTKHRIKTLYSGRQSKNLK